MARDILANAKAQATAKFGEETALQPNTYTRHGTHCRHTSSHIYVAEAAAPWPKKTRGVLAEMKSLHLRDLAAWHSCTRFVKTNDEG
jgi:hypothetical protein